MRDGPLFETIELEEGSKHGIAIPSYCARELDVETGEKLRIHRTVSGWHFATKSGGKVAGFHGSACVSHGKDLTLAFSATKIYTSRRRYSADTS